MNKNNFQQLFDADDDAGFAGMEEIENNLIGQVKTFSFFGNVVELFVPNALQTVVKMIGGDQNPTSGGGFRRPGGSPDSGATHWRVPPSGSPNQN